VPKLLKLNKEVATHKEVLTAMHCAPSKEGFHVYQAIDFLYQGKSIQEVADLLHFTEHSVRKWVHRFNDEGITGLAYRGKSGRPRKIPLDKFRADYVPLVLDPQLANEDNFTAIKFHFYLKEMCNEELCYQTVLNYFRENQLSRVVPRPSVISKQDQEKREQFIADFKSLVSDNKEIWFCDEVGFEGDPRPRARWVKIGSKPIQGRASEHLRYSAIGSINPASGEIFSFTVSSVDKDVFQVYLNELDKSTNGRELVLVLDNATWHSALSLNWHNIKPLYLPPYSPDLNPIEMLWRFMKINHFTNWYAKNIEELIERICYAFNSITKNQIMKTANPSYLLR
jgi:transposase